MVGKPFTQAAEQGITTYRKMSKTKDARIIELSKARKEFAPVTLRREEWRPGEPDASKLRAAFEADAKKLDATRYKYLKGNYAGMLKKDKEDLTALVGLGILEAQVGKSKAARSRLNQVLELDSVNAAALNNLGNLAYLEKDYKAAKASYLKASQADPEDPGVLLNLARASMKLGDKKEAKGFVDRAVKLDDGLGPVGKGILELE